MANATAGRNEGKKPRSSLFAANQQLKIDLSRMVFHFFYCSLSVALILYFRLNLYQYWYGMETTWIAVYTYRCTYAIEPSNFCNWASPLFGFIPFSTCHASLFQILYFLFSYWTFFLLYTRYSIYGCPSFSFFFFFSVALKNKHATIYRIGNSFFLLKHFASGEI